MKELFLDTNVIIDVLADRKPFSESAARLFDHAEKGKINLYISSLSYTVIYYIIRKSRSHKEALKTLADLDALTETLDVTKQIISHALHTGFKDFEDAVQYYTALADKRIAAIVTRNGKDFKKSELAVLTPEEALSALESP